MREMKKMGEVKETEYNGHPLLEFVSDGGYPIRLGVSKIKCVLDNIEHCKAFVGLHTTKKE